MTMQIRSRTGNVVLAVVGAIYTVAGLLTFAVYMMHVWQAAGLVDRLLLFGLGGAACGGVLFLVVGLQNLGFNLQRWRLRL